GEGPDGGPVLVVGDVEVLDGLVQVPEQAPQDLLRPRIAPVVVQPADPVEEVLHVLALHPALVHLTPPNHAVDHLRERSTGRPPAIPLFRCARWVGASSHPLPGTGIPGAQPAPAGQSPGDPPGVARAGPPRNQRSSGW